MKLAIIIPSRGLIHSRTIESIFENLALIEDKFDYKFFISHDKGIPDAQNYLVEKALKQGADYIWSIEEDNLIPPKALRMMLHYMRLPQIGVVCVDYPITAKKVSGVCRKNGKILWCPMGCTLIADWVFKEIGKPYFSTDKTWKIVSKNPLELEEQDIPNKYGGHDIYFGMQCQKHNILIYCVQDMVAGHIKPKDGVGTQFNKENYEFEIWNKIEQYQDYK